MGMLNLFKSVKKGVIDPAKGSFQLVVNGIVSWFADNKAAYLKNGYGKNVHVYVAVNVYLRKAKVAPFILSKVKSKKKLVKYDQFMQSKNQEHRLEAARLKDEALEELESHEIIDLLNKPNDYQTGVEFRESLLGFFKVLGETFVYGIAPSNGRNAGKFKELHVVPPTIIEPVYSGNILDPVSHYLIMVDGKQERIEKENVFHYKTWNPLSETGGLSPIKVGNKLLKTNDANNAAAAKAYENGGSAHLLSGKGERSLTPEQIDLLNERIAAQLKGTDNYKNIVATNGMVDVTKIGDSPAELELISADVHQRGIIASLFGVDPILVGDKQGSSFANQEQAYKALVTNSVMPDLNGIAEGLTAWLLPRFGNNLHLAFDTTVYPELQPDLELMMKVYGKPNLTPNEVRSIFKWDASKDPNMDRHYIESKMIPIEMAGTVKATGKDDEEK
ncbi:phage portal protein [Pedobacter sp. HDW13]|uniref:phage portal protein n=1 Tax=Pedobacter sp. HDW13 TaxID=2714940 RepID=UPI00140A9465|nr:phage portal protein [Pedobacter sp. HDW13]QIL41017.1 phage portal protein [Pedobacter sp. HDW13]